LPAGASQPGFRVVLRGDDPKLTMTMGDVELVADDTRVRIRTGDAQAMLETAGSGRIELKIGDASITITGGSDIVLKTGGKLSLSADQVEIAGQSSVTISGAQVKVN
jgi:phage gp45-like